MPERSRASLLVGALAGLFALFLVLAIMVSGSQQRDWRRDHSSLSRNPWGLAGWRELLERLQVPTHSWQQPLTELDRSVGLFLLLAPQSAIDEQEQQSLLHWVAGGGRLVVAAFGEAGTPLGQIGIGSGSVAGHGSIQELLARLGLTLVACRSEQAIAQVRARSALTRNVHRVLVPSPYRLAATEAPGDPRQGRVDLVIGEEPVLVTLRYGRGTVHVLSEVEILANRCIGRDDNALLAVNLVLAEGWPKGVYFDEYHRPSAEAGGEGEGPTVGRVDSSALDRLLLGLLAVAVIYGLGRAQRFGAPMLPGGQQRRWAADYVRAFAALYCRAHAREAAAHILSAHLRRRMARAARTSPQESVDRSTERLRARGLPGEQMAALLRALQQGPGPLSDGHLLRLARTMAQYERML